MTDQEHKIAAEKLCLLQAKSTAEHLTIVKNQIEASKEELEKMYGKYNKMLYPDYEARSYRNQGKEQAIEIIDKQIKLLQEVIERYET